MVKEKGFDTEFQFNDNNKTDKHWKESEERSDRQKRSFDFFGFLSQSL